MSAKLDTRGRRALHVDGIVQGVGFRPFVYRLAVRHGLGGFIRNETGGVAIEIEGDERSLDGFVRDLRQTAPQNARIGNLTCEFRAPQGDQRFTIESSKAHSASDPSFSPDLTTCPDCLRELLDPGDRRYRYAFTNCTNCGPRFTVVDGAPYDRERTSMAAFPLCGPCRAEYEDPLDRRYHAEATACPDCGPRLRLLSPAGKEVEALDPLAEACLRLRQGNIVAVKGLGGFHLACLAEEEKVVGRLRGRKERDEKPFAVMVADLAAARRLCEMSPAEEKLLLAPERPIVLAKRRKGASIAEGVAPGNPSLGLMLPYTPLHHLLLTEVGKRPLVLTSGNLSDEPIAYEDEDALRRLGTIADFVLTHDRAIRTRCDDSVARIAGGETLFLRRSRGYAPAPVRLPVRCAEPTLALGGALKATFALGRGEEALLSHHLGDLDHYEAFRAYGASIEKLEKLFHFSPRLIVHDLHPDYPSTRYALERAEQDGIRHIAVQHHHAHLAACMADNGLTGSVIGVTFDGTGFGTDGAIWGGEFLVGDYRGFRRAAHFETVPMPGGEQAIREPWRMGAAYLARAGEGTGLLEGRIPERSLDLVGRLMERDVNAPRTSSCGRLFDGVSSILGLRDRVSYEGQAAMELEWLARESAAKGFYPVGFARHGESWALEVSPLIAALAADLRKGALKEDIARRFHSTVVEMIRQACVRLRDESGLDRVALSGGVFMNEILSREVPAALEGEGFRVYGHHQVPPNDGGICLGQLAVAAAGGG